MSTDKKKKVLILEDESDVAKYLKTLLEDNGYVTSTAADGNEGMVKALAERPDLITLDISMPQKSGMRFLRELRESPELKATPVIVVTAISGYGGRWEEFKHFMDTRSQFPPPEGFFHKPIDRKEFLGAVEKLIGKG